MTEKKADGLGPGSIEIDGERLATFSWEDEGRKFTVREVTRDEISAINEATQGPDGKSNDTLNTNMALAKALVEPARTPETIGKFGNRTFLRILRAYNDLNSLPIEVPTPPAG